MIKYDFTQVLLGQIVSDVNMHNVYLQHGQSGYCAFYFWLSQKAKDAVSEGLKSKLHLTSKIKKELSEHEIDAVAITVTLLEYIKTTDGMSCIKYIDLE